MEISGGDGKTQSIVTRNIIIATGPAPRLLPNLKVDAPRIVTSDELLELKSVPKSLAVLGAGAVGVEFDPPSRVLARMSRSSNCCLASFR